MAAIEGIGPPGVPRTRPRGVVSDGRGFVVPEQAAAAGDARATAAASPASLSSMLTLQEMGAEVVEDREARRHAQDILAALTELQRALLGGGDESAVLQRLAALAETVPLAADRRLAAMVSAIILRARVELARRQS